MARTILVEKSTSYRRLISLNLELYTDSDVLFMANADQVIDHLKDDSKIDLIICENMVGDENTVLKIFYYVNSKKLNIPIILMGTNPKIANEVHMVEKTEWREIIKISAKLLSVTSESMAELEVPDYYPISLTSFIGLKKAPTDIFILKNEKYDVYLHAKAEVDQDAIKKMMTQKTFCLYVRKADRLKFGSSFSDQVIEYLESEDLTLEDRISATGAIFDSAYDKIQMAGITDETIELVKASIESMIKASSTNAGLLDLLDIIQRSQDSYLYKHSIFTSAVAHQIIDNIQWGHEDHKDKLTFMCFFHDICIPEESLCIIHTQSDLKSSQLSPEDKKRVMNHAFNACELLKDYPEVPFGGEALILQHHGNKNGIGFTLKQDVNISPLAIVFRIAEDYSNIALNADKEFFNKKSVFRKLRKKYNTGMYQTVLSTLEKCAS